MILFLSPFPAYERIGLAAAFTPGEKQPPMRITTFAGGAGLRAASAAKALGGDPLAIGFVGGRIGELLTERLDETKIMHRLVKTEAATRGNFLLLDKERGVVSELLDNPPIVTQAETEKLLQTATDALKSSQLLVVSDRDTTPDLGFWHSVFHQASRFNVPILADVIGETMDSAVAAGVYLLRANLETLQKRTEESLRHDSAIVAYARTLIARGVQNVCITLGEDGALLVDEKVAWRIRPPVVSRYKSVGCGECLVGGIAAHWARTNGSEPVEAVRVGCAAASASVAHDIPAETSLGETAILLRQTVSERVILR